MPRRPPRGGASLAGALWQVLVGAGSGLSISAGIDYSDEAGFASRHPALAARGIKCDAAMIANREAAAEPRLWWAYHARHAQFVLSQGERDEAHAALREIVGGRALRRAHFCVASTVDHLLERHGFDAQRVYTPHGSYRLLQCKRGCGQPAYDAAAEVARLCSNVEPGTGLLSPECALPTCPRCGGSACFNLNEFSQGGTRSHRRSPWYQDAHWGAARARLQEFLRGVAAAGQRLVVLEVGAGHATPGLLRNQLEEVARADPNATMVRINARRPEAPSVPEERSCELGWTAAAALAWIRDALRDAPPNPSVAPPVEASSTPRGWRGPKKPPRGHALDDPADFFFLTSTGRLAVLASRQHTSGRRLLW